MKQDEVWSEWVVNGQPITIGVRPRVSLLVLGTKAGKETGNLVLTRFPRDWELRCACGELLSWGQTWAQAMGRRSRLHTARSCSRASLPLVYMNMRPGVGG